MMTPDRARLRLASLDEGAEAFRLYRALEPALADLRVSKVMYSAFIAGSSDIDRELRERKVEAILIAGTATNVCCESSARDAMMLDYRVAMLSDANAAEYEEEHVAALNTFASCFGDVMTTDDAIARLVA